MGFGFLAFNMVLTLFFKLLACQEPNTDGYFVSEFFKRMRMDSSSSPFHNFSAPVCSWQGVFCDAEEAYVEGLMASGLGLSGAIPDVTIGKLSRLQSLDLSSNEITALPTDMWSLGSLKSLNLSNNQISGFLPNNIDNFGVLETLDLSRNSFSGEIPPALGSLLSLRVLKLNGNQFEGRVPVGILSCISLVVMDFSMNKLNGSLPDGFGAAFSKLQSLDLAGNGIEGREPDFTQLHSLISLNISGNLFQGSVIGLFMEQLQVMDLSRNKFEGLISQVQFNSSSSLVHLDLSENQFSGEMLEGFSHVQNLKHLNLAFNRFSRNSFPESYKLWGLRLELEYLNLSNTNLIGQIPPEISKLSNLHTLDLSQNHLTGHIPYSLTMKSLQVLDVSQNNMTGQIPYSVLQKLPWMESFNFSYNNFTFCGSEISPQTFETRFVGSSSNCPIAANPALFQRKPTDDNKGLKLALALTISMVVLLFGILCFAFGCRRKSTMWPVKQHKEEEQQNNISGPFSFRTDSTTWVADVKQANSVGVIIFEKPLLNITFADLLTATSNFDRGTTLLSEGKFGPVYSGFLPGGIHVAVKVLVHGSTLTEHEAARELEFLGRIKHPNLVPLTGYCLAGDQRIALYDYMENGNLQNLLHGRGSEDSEGLPITSWEFRHKIALGTARALAFLHHGCSPPIIHRDVKASSVYLDSNLDPKLSDFGLAKLFGNGLDQIEIGGDGDDDGDDDDDLRHAATTKSDVYWYGVILFELISGRNPAEDGNLVSWVRELVRTNQSSRAIDSRILGTGFDVCNMEEVLKIGYLCTADLPAKRPSMQQVVGLLKDIEPRRDNSNVLVVSRSS